jgi:PIN domain nuclease of toxin-antitoxin system
MSCHTSTAKENCPPGRRSSQVAHLYASELAVSSPHTLAAGQLDWDHNDPFDRMIAAQAMVEGLTLVTADEDLHAFGPVATLW